MAVGVGAMVGTWDTEGSTTSAIFDNFNVWHPVYAYDANGNLTSDGSKCYDYNEANQLSKVKECGNNHTIAEYVYDYTGLRTVKKNYVTGTLSNTVVSWSDGYETKTPVGGSAQNTAYYWVNGELLSKKDNSGNRFYYHNDHLGSASLLTNSSGAVTEETSYDPWGVVQSGGEKSKFQYTGQEKDSETGLNYYNARYYSSDMRRFTQPDDIIQDIYDPQMLNRYAYVRNNPQRYTDPSGHCIGPLIFACGAVAAVAVRYAPTIINTVTKWVSSPTVRNVATSTVNITKTVVGNIANTAKSTVSNVGKISNTTSSAPVVHTPKTSSAPVHTGTNTVYQAINSGQSYYGMTKDFAQRSMQHGSRFTTIQPVPGLEKLSRYDARAVEQALIERNGLPNLLNKINSISTKNPRYTDSIMRGNEILDMTGI